MTDEVATLTADLTRIDEALGKLYRERDPILVRLAELRDYELPKPRHRTDTQAKVARCPRCRERLSGSGE